MNQMQGGGSKVMSFGKSRAKRMSVDSPKITFKDVAGVDEAVEELQEIKEFLENPKKFQALGARIPKGVLLFGPPGTGKTLLARAVAGEAGVPFFSISGSDFVEMFVGVGASRVRDLFEQAKQNSPCIIFMDEIDAVGRHRGAGMGGGHDEREQTLNQLLVEMDGFEMKDNVILIAATNRPDILDPALLRPGRFDRQVVVDRPDRVGRKKILEVHSRGKPMSQTVDIEALAGQTPGFTGADLANLVNEAALLAARKGKKQIENLELEEGIMRVIAGPEKKTRLLSPKEREITAVHEMGHALVGHYLDAQRPGAQDLDRRARHGPRLRGHAAERGQVHALARRAARRPRQEPGRPHGRGARLRRGHDRRRGRPQQDDRHRQADGHALGHVREARAAHVRARLVSSRSSGRDFGHEADYSEEIAREIDDEIRRIVEPAHERAREVLTSHIDELQSMSKILIQYETFDADQFQRLLSGEAPEDVFADQEPKESDTPVAEQPRKEPGRAARHRPPAPRQHRLRPAAGVAAAELSPFPDAGATGSRRDWFLTDGVRPRIGRRRRDVTRMAHTAADRGPKRRRHVPEPSRKRKPPRCGV